MTADKYQLQATKIPDGPFAKVSVDLIIKFSVTNNGNMNNISKNTYLVNKFSCLIMMGRFQKTC